MLCVRFGRWLNLLVIVLLSLRAEGFNVSITYVHTAIAKGAVCLDGSAPAYHMDKGYGTGINNWLVHIEGGGWCNNASTCLQRKNTRLGSSKQMAKSIAFSGILSNQDKYNPDFFNWNRIKVRYCDGASFTGDVESVDPDTNLHYRGARVFIAVIEDLLAKGMSNAKNAMISGCSAGGLTSILHCDSFKSLLPAAAKVKCLADAGYFVNVKDISGSPHIEEFFGQVVATHGSVKHLPSYCTKVTSPPGLCFFPKNLAGSIATPLFILNAAYDSWQIKNALAPGVSDRHGLWHNCKADITKCSSPQLEIIQGFRTQFMFALNGVGTSFPRGKFIDGCYAHCQSETQETWLSKGSPVVNNMSIAKAVGDWFTDRRYVEHIDCRYPCNHSCHNRIFE